MRFLKIIQRLGGCQLLNTFTAKVNHG
jgi:hypothetical protein